VLQAILSKEKMSNASATHELVGRRRRTCHEVRKS
jgi:hypothetical protein